MDNREKHLIQQSIQKHLTMYMPRRHRLPVDVVEDLTKSMMQDIQEIHKVTRRPTRRGLFQVIRKMLRK